MKIMISQPMKRRTNEEIKKERKEMVDKFNKLHIEVVDTFFEEEAEGYNHVALYYIAKSVMEMAKVDAVYFADNWQNARGCRIEHQIAKEYGIKILYSDFLRNSNENIKRAI